MLAFPEQIFTQRLVVLDHAVVHEGELPALVEMRMRILVGRLAMRRPARVTDAVMPRRRLLRHELAEIRDTAGAFARLDPFAVDDRDAGGIVAAIFQPAQTVQQDGPRFRAPDVANNAAHAGDCSSCASEPQPWCQSRRSAAANHEWSWRT